MDKTISISLGGYSFIIDEPAYLKLKKYLDDIRRSLKGMEGTDDVISDVEIRIAELFKEKLGNREVVSEPEVDQIIGIMGKPEQYVDDEDAETGSERKSGFTSGAATAGKKNCIVIRMTKCWAACCRALRTISALKAGSPV